MSRLIALGAVVLLAGCGGFFREETAKMDDAKLGPFHDLEVTGIDGQAQSLRTYEGEVLLVVNVASECGFTGQYQGLQALQAEYGERGFRVLAFPCNDFGGQEPGTEGEIQAFCSSRYGVTFPLHSKVQVKAGEGQAPLYRWLGGATGELPGWNFGKYLVSRDGKALAFFPSNVAPEASELRDAIAAAL